MGSQPGYREDAVRPDKGLPLVDLRLETEVESFQQNDRNVTIEVRTPTGLETVVADYLVVAEGSRSRLRNEILNVRMEGNADLARSFSGK